MTQSLFRGMLVLFYLNAFGSSLAAQDDNIQIRFLRAWFTDTVAGSDLLAAFVVTTPDSASFPPMVMLPPKCTVFENGREKVLLLTPQMLALSLYGENIPEKGPDVYARIKDLVDLKALQTSLIVTYGIKDIPYRFSRMSLTPAFREKQNNSVRVEKRFEFEVE